MMEMAENNRNSLFGDLQDQLLARARAENCSALNGSLQKNLADFKAAKKRLESNIREYFRSQKQLWRQVPYFALEADGRSGWSGYLDLAYRMGYYPLLDRMGLYIDLETGELVDKHTAYGLYMVGEPQEIDDSYIAEIAHNIEAGYYEAGKLIDELKKQADYTPTQSNCGSGREAENNAVRERLRKEYNVEKIYHRHRKNADEPAPDLEDLFRNVDYPQVNNLDLDMYDLGNWAEDD